MYGAILGDIIGSPYEFDMGNKSKDFEFFEGNAGFTDDTVMTIAVAEGILGAGLDADVSKIKEKVITSMKKWGRKYPYAGYGARFNHWIQQEDSEPYGSYGNGSAMRVSSVGWLFDSIERTREVAKSTAEVTHNHPEGLKGAEATASVIFLARLGNSKSDIKNYVMQEFGYDLSRTCDEIRPDYHHVESCQETVPEAIMAFLEGESFEDVIRTAVSLGGDCDTLTAIAGSMAEAYYGVSEWLVRRAEEELTEEMIEVLRRFNTYRKGSVVCFYHENEENGYMSNWYETPFEYAGMKYSSVEQYMMFQKVIMFRQYNLADRIMSTTNPATIKRLGRTKFENFNPEMWEKICKRIVKRGVRAKFIQNPDLIDKLLLTGQSVLAECSSRDKKWGIGVNIGNKNCYDVRAWKGENLLGQILMEVRDELRLARKMRICEYEDARSMNFPIWRMNVDEIRRNPRYHKVVQTYADTLNDFWARKCFFELAFMDWEEAMRTNMGGGLPAAGFWEMKQEVYEIWRGKVRL